MTLRCEAVSVVRAGRRLVDRVSIELRSGEMTAILGPNGAGKSTLLRVMAGDIPPDEGWVRLSDRDLGEWSPLELARRRAVLPQLSGLSFPFTVAEVVQLGRHPHGDADAPSGRKAVERALHIMELDRLRNADYSVLSGGERQRAHAARVLAQVDGASHEPWVLLDEPTSALDVVHQHQLLQALAQLAADGAGVVVVLHDPNLAARYAQALLLLGEGRLLAHGATDEVLVPESLERLYGVPVEVIRLDGRDHPIIVAGAPPPSPRPQAD